MASMNSSGRPAGSVSIPVEILPGSNSRLHSPLRTYRSGYSFNNSSNPPTRNSYSTSRFQPRQSPVTAYDRLINNSQFNQPLHGRFSSQQHPEATYRHWPQRAYEPDSSHFNRSTEDLLASPMETTQSKQQSPYSSKLHNGYRADSEYVQPNKYSSYLHRSFDGLNDFSDTCQSFPVNRSHPYDYGVPTNHDQSNTFPQGNHTPHDRSGSPGSQRDSSPTRPATSSASQQPQSDLNIPNDTTCPIPMSTSPTSQLPDQQVPSTDTPVPSPPVRDPNTVALGKVEQIQQSLAHFDQQVDTFIGSTRNDRLYKVLDEQAVNIMMRCDELVDVSSDIKEKRKEMIRNVQTILAKLESKVPLTSSIDENSNQMETTAMVISDPSTDNNRDQMTTSSEHNSSIEQDT